MGPGSGHRRAQLICHIVVRLGEPDRQARRRINRRGIDDLPHRISASAGEDRGRDRRGVEDMVGLAQQPRGAMKARWIAAPDRRRALDAALAPGGALDPLDAAAADKVAAWLASDTATRPSRLETIHLASADPDDLTLRAARLLGEADHIFHPASIPAAILARARADAVRHVIDAAPDDPRPGLSIWLAPPHDIMRS